VLKWSREHCPWDEETCAYAARGGHLEVLKRVREHDCPWDRWTCTDAAQSGQLEVLKWAREHHCQWDEGTCRLTAQSEHLDVLKWVREHHCPWDEQACCIRRVLGPSEGAAVGDGARCPYLPIVYTMVRAPIARRSPCHGSP
jgi:hypothetical protein